MTHFEKMAQIFEKYAQISIDAGKIRSDLNAQTLEIQTRILMNGLMATAQSFPSTDEAKSVLQNKFSLLVQSFKR